MLVTLIILFSRGLLAFYRVTRAYIVHGLEIQSSIVLPMAESLYTELSIEVLAISGYFWLFSKISIYYRFKTTSGSPLDKTRRNQNNVRFTQPRGQY